MSPVGESRPPRPRKALGQHWLVDRRLLGRIAGACDFGEADTVIEVGAGPGNLTELLSRRAPRLIAVEVDAELAAALRRRFQARPNVAVVEADVLSLAPADLLTRGKGGPPYVVVGNLPFFIGTAILRHFLYAAEPPRWLVVTLQEEVARSIVAVPGGMTFLSVEIQLLAVPRLLFRIPPRAFRPPPKVHAAVLRLDVRPRPAVGVDNRGAFLRLVQAGFAAPRKHIRNSLALGTALPPSKVEAALKEAGVDPTWRPAVLSLEDWARLYEACRQVGGCPQPPGGGRGLADPGAERRPGLLKLLR